MRPCCSVLAYSPSVTRFLNRLVADIFPWLIRVPMSSRHRRVNERLGIGVPGAKYAHTGHMVAHGATARLWLALLQLIAP